MSSHQYLINASTRHQVFLQRYAAGQSKVALRTLNRLRRDIMARLSQEPTEFQRQRLEAVLADIDQLYQNATLQISRTTITANRQLAESEAAFNVKLYSKASTVNFRIPSTEALIAAVESAPMVPLKPGAASVNIQEALAQFGMKKAKQVTQIISDGVSLGKPTGEIITEVGVHINTLQRRQLRTLVHTATNHVSSVARAATFAGNGELIEGYEWVSTLDGRTTFICASRDGEVYQVGAGPMPPAHWGCRSTTIPRIRAEYNVAGRGGQRPSVGDSGAQLVSANMTYGTWLKQQPVGFVDEALGVERSRLFRSGKLSIEQFVDPTGRVYTLQQLEQMHPFVFLN